MPNHEFGIVDDIMYGVDYVYYEPEKYNCISVNDDLIGEIINVYIEEFKTLKTYAHSTTEPIYGLDYCGITLIPPESLERFRNIIVSANSLYKSQEFDDLIDKIFNAMLENKYLIHFGT